jgi:hypothetical protein
MVPSGCQMPGAGPAAPPAPAMMSLVRTSTWISQQPKVAAKQSLEAQVDCKTLPGVLGLTVAPAVAALP